MDGANKNGQDLVFWSRVIYILAIIIWLLIIIWLELYKYGWLVTLLLFLPLVIFITGYLYAPSCTAQQEEAVFEASFLAIGLLVLMPLVNWMKDNYGGDKKELIRLILAGISITLLSVLDVWWPTRLMRLNNHIRLCFETMAVILFICIIVIFYEGLII